MGLLFFCNRVEAWVGIEKIGYKGKIEFGIASDERRRRKELPAIDFVGIIEDLLCSLEEIARLKWRAAADVWF